MSIQLRNKITTRIIDLLENGVKHSGKRWINNFCKESPRNLKSKNAYRGINALTLWAESMERGYSSPYWLTYNQATELGGSVRKGEKSVICCYYNMVTKKEMDDGLVDEGAIENSYLLMKPFWLFNLEQIDGLVSADNSLEFEPIDKAEALIAATGAEIHNGGNKARYFPAFDAIELPKKEAFTSVENYYATAFHELGHWTGHETRLKRDFSGKFKSEAYAMEELVAELSAAFMMGELGLSGSLEMHASYIDSWLEVIKSHEGALFTAASQSQKAADYILKFIEQPNINLSEEPLKIAA